MKNLREEINKRVLIEDPAYLTSVIRMCDSIAEMTVISMSENETIIKRMEKAPFPLRAFPGSESMVMGITERLKNEKEYLERFLKLAKDENLDKDFDIISSGFSYGEKIKSLKLNNK